MVNNNSWPYDRLGYCIYCGIAQYKPHKLECLYREAIEKARQTDASRIVDKTPFGGVHKKVEAF